jgi:hypothetical protein
VVAARRRYGNAVNIGEWSTVDVRERHTVDVCYGFEWRSIKVII